MSYPMSRARGEKALKLAVKKGRLFAWGNMQTEPETLLESRWARRSACFPAQVAGKYFETPPD